MYPSLNPFILRKERATEVFRLIRLVKLNNNYTNKNGDVVQQTNNKRSIRRNVTGKRGTGGWI